MNKPKVKQHDIAKVAEVSLATVDRVLNDRPGVKPETQKRIWDAVRRIENGQAAASTRVRNPSRLDFVLPAGPNTFMSILEDEIRKIAQSLSLEGVEIHCHRVEGFNADALARTLHRIAEKSHGIGVVALENPIVREAVNTIIDRGIPVVTLVSDLSTPKKLGYIGLDNRAAGRTAGYLVSRFSKKKNGPIAMFEGSLKLSYRDHQERELGFRDALREYAPDLKVLGCWETQDNFEEAYRLTNQLLDNHPDLVGIYSIGGGIRGIAHALQEHGNGEQITFIGHELTAHTRQYLIEGTLDAVIHQDPPVQAKLAVETLLAKVRGEDVSPPNHVPIQVFFRENLP